MAQCGWQINALTRNDQNKHNSESVNWISGDLDDNSSLQVAADGVDVIVHAINVPYAEWNPKMITYTRQIIELAETHRAHLVFIGNCYNAGLPTGGLIGADTPDNPITTKGQLRSELETMIRLSAADGVRSTIMRFGDFFGPNLPKSNWFNQCTKSVSRNKLTLPGPVDIPHTWAYLPDAAEALEQVITKRLTHYNKRETSSDTAGDDHRVFTYSGHRFSFQELQNIIEVQRDITLRINKIPWLLFKVFGLFIPQFRELNEMRYLWDYDIAMDDTALTEFLGSTPNKTPLPEAVDVSLSGNEDFIEQTA